VIISSSARGGMGKRRQMKLGFLTSQVDDIRKAAELGFPAVELEMSALGDPKVGEIPDAAIEAALNHVTECRVEITALAYYGLASDSPPGDAIEEVYERVFAAAAKLSVGTVASMSGFDADLDWRGNLELFARRFGRLAERAEARGLRLAVENWMGFAGQLPFRPRNMGGSPATWRSWFELVPSPALGLEFDPSHLFWQGIDPVRALAEFADRVYHFHAKDVELLLENRYRFGINGDTFRFRIPGYGDLDWPKLISVLIEKGYRGGVAIEHEDEVFSGERFDEGLIRGWRALYPLVHPGAVRNSSDVSKGED
jgi:sugar phosphate isomerase/epimerase